MTSAREQAESIVVTSPTVLGNSGTIARFPVFAAANTGCLLHHTTAKTFRVESDHLSDRPNEPPPQAGLPHLLDSLIEATAASRRVQESSYSTGGTYPRLGCGQTALSHLIQTTRA